MKKLTVVILVIVSLCLVGAALADVWTCSNCGKENEGNFCAWCGTKKPDEKIVCPSCSAEIDPNLGALFCGNCGAKLVTETETEPEADPVSEMAEAEQTPEPVTEVATEEATQIRQVLDHVFSGGTMINPEAYPEIRLMTHTPQYIDKLSNYTNTVSFPLPENTVPDSYDENSALVIDNSNPDCSISYEYILHEGTTLKKLMEKAPEYRIMVQDDKKIKVFLNMQGCRAHAYLDAKKANSVLEIIYRIVDWDAYPEDQMKEVLTAGIQKEQERVLSEIKYSHTEAGKWWTAGKYSGISMLDGANGDHRVNIVFPELSITVNGETLTGQVFPYKVDHDRVTAAAFFPPETCIDLEFNISDYYPGVIKKVQEGAADTKTITLADGKEWAAELVGISDKKSTSLIRISRKLHNHGGRQRNNPLYFHVTIMISGPGMYTYFNSDNVEDFLNSVVVNLTDEPSPNEP